ncbi:MAG: extracellular solute-binding protein [Clostridia bacterium]|nr:extracellular solute-binding protein [Clostridia bacterium]
MKKYIKAFLCLVLSAGIVVGQTFNASAQIISVEISQKEEYTAYTVYSEKAVENNSGKGISLTAEQLAEKSDGVEILENYKDLNGKSINTPEGSTVSWKADVTEGWYTMRITYYLSESRSNYAQRKILINGEVPFEEAANINLYCAFIDEKGIITDYYGNDIRSTQVISPMWLTTDIYDKVQYRTTPLKFYLKNGDLVTLDAVTEDLIISTVELLPYCELKTYSEVSAEYEQSGYLEAKNVCDIYQAEAPNYKTDPTVLPATDNNASTVPQDSYLIKLNKISGGNWKSSGQKLCWKIYVPKAGLYNITLKTKQSSDRGTYSTRRLYINGEVPFSEANCIKFLYSRNWENITLGADGNPWLFYLKEGENTIELEATLGDMGVVLQEASDILEELNKIYRELLVVTGSTPDKYRNYNLDKLLPDTLSNIAVQKDRLNNVLNAIYEITGKKGSNLSIFSTIINQLDEFCKDDEKIPTGFEYYKTNIGSFGTWITSALSQPLDLDYIVVSSPEKELPKAQVNVFKKFTSWLTSFIASFVVDYDSIGNMTENTKKPITVWMTSGRDQMQILKVLIQNSFIQQTGINVKLENVEAGAILKAIAANNGPDVLIGASVSDPVNYALRNAAYNLNKFEDIDEVTARFYDENLVPLSFGGGLFALPETLTFDIMFYRTDIMNELGISIPETWDDVTEVISILQKNNMTFGLPVADIVGTYATFLYQHGGELYNEDGSLCLLTELVNTEAFNMLTNYFDNYSLELSYNLVNRFRTGEIPIAIADIATYNNLMVSAPEIEGLWGIALLPGIKQDDGSINRTGYVTTTSSMVLNGTDMPNEAYEFIKWWTTDEIQSEFGTELESILGPSSRYLTANKKAFEALPWNEAELQVIDTQLSAAKAVPQVPGSYYIARHLNNAFRAIVISGEDLRDTLSKYNETINAELKTKRQEFDLD